MSAKTLKARWEAGHFDAFLGASPSFGLRTGFEAVDELTAGLDGITILVSEKPAYGKTSLVTELAVRASENGNRTALLPLEESPFSTSSRLLARISEQTVQQVRSGLTPESRDKVEAWMRDHGGHLQVVGLHDIGPRAGSLKLFGRAKLVIIDSLQHFAEHLATGGDEKERIDRALLLMRKVASTEGTSFFVLSQVGMNGLRSSIFFGGSSRVSFDADTILTLKRLPGYKAELSATKQRVPTAKTSALLRYLKDASRFEAVK